MGTPLQGNTTRLESHMLLVTIPGGLPPSMAPTDGNQPLIDLSTFPRLRLGGNNTLSVSVQTIMQWSFGKSWIHQVFADAWDYVMITLLCIVQSCLFRRVNFHSLIVGVSLQALNFSYIILYSRKYWRELNLAVGPQIAFAKILADLNLVVQ